LKPLSLLKFSLFSLILTCRESIKLYIAKPGHLKYWHHIQNTVCI
jgi:hypothetical protein